MPCCRYWVCLVGGAGNGPQASEVLRQMHWNTLQPKCLHFISVTSGNCCLKNEYSLRIPGDSLDSRHSASCWQQDLSWHQGLVLQKAKCSKDLREGKGFLRVRAGHTLSSFRSAPSTVAPCTRWLVINSFGTSQQLQALSEASWS